MFAQITKIVERFIESGKVQIADIPEDHLDIRRTLAVMFNMQSIVVHIRKHIERDNSETENLIFRSGNRTKSTMDVRPYSTTKEVMRAAKKSHIQPSPCDSSWEKNASKELEKNNLVESWVKNERLGFSIDYQYEGNGGIYHPDFLARLTKDGKSMMLVLEIKGQKSAKNDAKHEALARWVRAVNADGRFGVWNWGVAYDEKGVDTARIIRESITKLDAGG